MTLLDHVHFEPLFLFWRSVTYPAVTILDLCNWLLLVTIYTDSIEFDDFSNFSQFLWIFILPSSIPELSQLLIFGKLNTRLFCSITQVIYSGIEDFTQHIDTFSLGSNSVLYVGITVSARLHLPSLLVINTIQIISELTYVIFCFTHLELLRHCRRKFDELDMNLPWKNTLLILSLSSKCLRMAS